MTRQEVLTTLCRNITAVLPDTSEADVQPHQRLEELGANSLDRIDILAGTLEDLGLELETRELVGAPTIDDLVDRLHGSCQTT